MKEIKLRIVDWWEKDNEENFYKNTFVQILSRKFKVVYSKNPDYVIFGPFGLEHIKYKNAIKIFITGEVAMSDYNVADYGIDFEYLAYNDRHLRYPYAFWNKTNFELAKNKHLQEFETGIRNKFCSYMVSMPTKDSPRDEFFKKLCEYKKVDSGGRHLNNIGGGYITDKIEWLRNYKFNICFENAASAGYFTEKMIDAFAGGCVPIYWGDPSLLKPELVPSILSEYKINPKAFINVQSFSSFDEAIEEIKRIDNDDEAYMAMLKEPAFLDDVNWYEYYQKRLEEFLFFIFDQDYKDAKRVPQTHYIRRYLRNNYNIINAGYLQYLFKNLKNKIKGK